VGSNIILAIGALVTFGILLSSSNRLISGNTTIAEQNEYYISALALGQSVIDEAKTKYFDQRADSMGVARPESLSVTLGRDGLTEADVPSTDTLTSAAPFSSNAPGFRSQSKFNDVDDYNNYRRLVNTPRAEGFSISVKVMYASQTTPDSASVAPTYCKVMYVYVTSPYLPRIESEGMSHPDTVRLSYAFTY
jgi:hypothetical protein